MSEVLIARIGQLEERVTELQSTLAERDAQLATTQTALGVATQALHTTGHVARCYTPVEVVDFTAEKVAEIESLVLAGVGIQPEG